MYRRLEVNMEGLLSGIYATFGTAAGVVVGFIAGSAVGFMLGLIGKLLHR
jgi:hypothetical protein